MASPLARSLAPGLALLPPLLALLAACAPDEGGEVVGSSHSTTIAPAPTRDAGLADTDPQLPPTWRQTFVTLPSLAPSRGHGTGNWPITVYADKAAAEALVHRSEAPPGSIFVAVHARASGEVLFVMQKDSGGDDAGDGWHYRARDAHGVTRDPAACEPCHSQAPVDHLYVVGSVSSL